MHSLNQLVTHPGNLVAKQLLSVTSGQREDVKHRSFAAQNTCAGILALTAKCFSFSKKMNMLLQLAWYLALGPELEGRW